MPETLSPHPYIQRRPGPVVLCVMDGIGLGRGGPDDAVANAHTPHLVRLLGGSPWLRVQAHGTAVGLPSDDDMGNSEVGHNAMGAGRVFDQGAKLVNAAFASGAAFEGDVWKRLCAGRTLHLLGLVSSGNVHSHTDHLARLIDEAAKAGVKRLRVHVLTDGRDVPGRSALQWVRPLEEQLAGYTAKGLDYRVGSGGGRMRITMDRYEADWPMVARGWATHVRGEGRPFRSASEAIETFYGEDGKVDDQWLPAFVIAGDDGQPVGRIGDGDSVLFFNFRGDRAVEISRAFEDETFTKFDRGPRPDVFYAGMMQYDGDLALPKHFLVAPPAIDRTVGAYLAANGLTTFACSETQKFGHVTYFFNGNRSGKFDDALETYVQVPSDTKAFQDRPWMKAAEITDECIDAIASGKYAHVRLNYANGDMVGHTGDYTATRLAVEAVDHQLGRLIDAVTAADGVLLVTADHGNADEMWTWEKGKLVRDASGAPKPRTAHTLHPVPFVVFDPRGVYDVRRDVPKPGLASIATTVLELCGLTAPPDYLPGLVK
jgi:2,3-bisphosphoglycerate-independent phosphoglycerate mutase